MSILANIAATSDPDEMSRDSLSAMIYQSIRTNLMTSAFEPGERLNIRRLAAMFGTSPTPVREAVMQLVREGGLELRPGHELRVPVLTVERYIKIRQVRAPLERLAAELATANVTAALLSQLGAINDEFMQAEDSGQWKNALLLNTRFHFTLYSASQNEVLVNAIESLWLLTGPFLINQYPSAHHPHDNKHPHVMLIEALKEGDASKAGSIVMSGLEQGGTMITEKLKRAFAI